MEAMKDMFRDIPQSDMKGKLDETLGYEHSRFIGRQ